MTTRLLRSPDEPECVGEGITYTNSSAARLWPVEVPFPGRPPMRCTIRATSQRQALQFAAARHPTANAAAIRVLPKTEAWELLVP